MRFIVTGAAGSGAKLVAEALNKSAKIACRVQCLAATEASRAADHAAWFQRKTIDVEHFADGEFNAQQYLSEWVFDRCRGSEEATGAYVPYETIDRYGLLEFFEELSRAGDFSVIHIVRHPLVCYAARQYGRCRTASDLPKIERYLRSYARSRLAVETRLRHDHLPVSYERLHRSPNRCLRRIAQYLEVDERPKMRGRPPCHPWQPQYARITGERLPLADDVSHFWQTPGY